MWTYSGDPSTSLLDHVRFAIQDTDVNAQLLQDAEIWFVINAEIPYSNQKEPAPAEIIHTEAGCLAVIARKFAAMADVEMGSLRVQYTKMAVQYDERAKDHRLKAQGSHAPSAGGLSESAKEASQQNPDAVQPSFTRKQFENPYRAAPLGGPVKPGEEGPI